MFLLTMLFHEDFNFFQQISYESKKKKIVNSIGGWPITVIKITIILTKKVKIQNSMAIK